MSETDKAKAEYMMLRLYYDEEHARRVSGWSGPEWVPDRGWVKSEDGAA